MFPINVRNYDNLVLDKLFNLSGINGPRDVNKHPGN